MVTRKGYVVLSKNKYIDKWVLKSHISNTEKRIIGRKKMSVTSFENSKRRNNQVCFGRVNLMTSLMEQMSKQNPSKSRREISREVFDVMRVMNTNPWWLLKLSYEQLDTLVMD